MKRLIINADDLGLSEGVNNAILDCAKAGALRSATALSMAPAFEHGFDRLAPRESFSLGIHLNLTGQWGSPTGRVPFGFFNGTPGKLLVASLAGRVDLDYVERCLHRQFEAFLDACGTPTHYDGHHHVHMFPGIARVAAKVAKEYGVAKARVSNEEMVDPRRGHGIGIKRKLVSMLSRSARRHLRAREIHSPDNFFGFGLMDKKDFRQRLHSLVSHAGEGFTEIMVHPGPEEADFHFDPYTERYAETEALKDKALLDLLEEKGIQTASYKDLE